MSNDSNTQTNLVLPSSLRKEMQIQCKFQCSFTAVTRISHKAIMGPCYQLCHRVSVDSISRDAFSYFKNNNFLSSSVHQQRWPHRLWNAMGDSISVQLHRTS